VDWKRRLSSSAAERYVERLSETIFRGRYFRFTNLRKAFGNVSSLRSSTTSKCRARVDAHVNRQM
jgi:hypothetical protein